MREIKEFLKNKEKKTKVIINKYEEEVNIINSFKKIINEVSGEKEVNYSELIYNLLNKLSKDRQKEILEMCGFSQEVKEKKIKIEKINELDLIIDKIKEKYGDEIKYGSWEEIKQTILNVQKEQLSIKQKVKIDKK